MNQTRLSCGPASCNILLTLGIVASLILGRTITGYCQAPQKPGSQAGSSVAKSTPASGYLSKSAPPGLRFASPPKPPVAYLPPLPISYDPQPVLSSEFAPPTTEVPIPKVVIAPPPPPLVTAVPLASLVSNFATNKPGQIPATPVDLGAMSPQMLVRFFQNGKLGEVELVLTNAVSFRVPVRDEKPSSSASYEVK